jgi:hypothetical protein
MKRPRMPPTGTDVDPLPTLGAMFHIHLDLVTIARLPQAKRRALLDSLARLMGTQQAPLPRPRTTDIFASTKRRLR